MKVRYIWYATVLMLSAALGFGLYQKRTYTDIASDPVYLEEIYVAQAPEDIALRDCEKLEEELPSAPNIFRVRAKEAVEYIGGSGRQQAEITEIFRGSGLSVGDRIYLTSSKWSLRLFSEPHSIERGFVNIMETDGEYLVFCRERLEDTGELLPIYSLYLPEEGSAIAPLFALEEHRNKVGAMWVGTTYTPYREVRDNEFFAATCTALEAMEGLKAAMLDRYP